MMAMREDELLDRVRQWIRQNHQSTAADTLDLSDGTDLIASGLLDSMAFVELIVFVEALTNAKVDLSDIDPVEFTTVRGFCRSVLHNGNGTGPARP